MGRVTATSAVRPFRIDVADEVLDDLRERLARTRWPEPIPGSGRDYGADVTAVRSLCEYWRTSYDWHSAQARLNAHEQLLVAVDGVELHVLRTRGSDPHALPLLLVHGWPGSVWEFMDVARLMPEFDLVIVSLPGFGFSGAPRERGWGVSRIAAALNTLMTTLGHDRYGAQGGDWGGAICSQLGVDFPQRCQAIHLNLAFANLPDPLPESLGDVARAQARFARRETGYSHVQATKPDSLTLAQNDSPAGLAAWILEKFDTWAEGPVSPDDLLTNIMFYWATASAPSAARIYWEYRHDHVARALATVRVPTAVAAFPAEPFQPPRAAVEARYEVVRWTDMPRGGHFAALEQPDLLAADMREFFAAFAQG